MESINQQQIVSNVNYKDILLAVKEKQKNFLDQYGNIVEKTLSDCRMHISMTYARLSLVAKILRDANIVNSHKEVDIVVKGTLFPSSLVLFVNYGLNFVYLLNSVKHVFVYEGIATEHPSNISLLIWSGDYQMKKYYNVLDDSFDWKVFTLDVTDIIYKTAYKRRELIDGLINVI